MSIVHVLYRAILLVRTGPFGEACSPLRAVRVHLEKYTEQLSRNVSRAAVRLAKCAVYRECAPA